MSEQCERASERWSECPSTLRVDFIVFQPTVDSIKIHRDLYRSISSGSTKSVMAMRICRFAVDASISWSGIPAEKDSPSRFNLKLVRPRWEGD